MKITISRGSILFLSISLFILSTLLVTSCSESEGIEFSDDTALIEKIESASKITVNTSDLPSATTSVFNGDLADSFIEIAQLASGLGYKIAIITDNVSREESKSNVFFSVQGKQLNDTNDKRKRRRYKCFEFVYPVDLIMPDNTAIILNSKEDWSLKKAWYEANPDATERPELVFPLDVTLEDGSVQTLIDSDELKTIKDSCRKGKDKRKCFKLVFPVRFTMEDASVIEVTERADFKLLREWKKSNPDATVRPALNYPADIIYKDDTVETINDAIEMQTAKDDCRY